LQAAGRGAYVPPGREWRTSSISGMVLSMGTSANTKKSL
jgi:hypothetical protein